MSDPGPNFPPIIVRSDDDIAEALAAQQASINIYSQLPDGTRAALGAWLERHRG